MRAFSQYAIIMALATFLQFLGPSTGSANPFYDTSLVRNAPIDVFERALSAGISPNTWSQNIVRASPVMIAATENRQDIVELLVSWGADVNAPTIDGRTPLFQVALQGSASMLRYLISVGAEVNPPGKSPIIAAMSEMSGAESIEKVRELFSAGARLDLPNDEGLLPLTAAARNLAFGVQLVRLLIDSGADVRAVAPNGRTMTAQAVASYNVNLLRFLFGIDPTFFSKDQSERPLIHYVLEGRMSRPRDPESQLEVLSFLVGSGADINSRDASGATILHYAARGENASLLQSLIAGGADPSIRDVGGRLPLDLARTGPLLGHPAFFALEDATR